mgnify:CR=1 FL=1
MPIKIITLNSIDDIPDAISQAIEETKSNQSKFTEAECHAFVAEGVKGFRQETIETTIATDEKELDNLEAAYVMGMKAACYIVGSIGLEGLRLGLKSELKRVMRRAEQQGFVVGDKVKPQ